MNESMAVVESDSVPVRSRSIVAIGADSSAYARSSSRGQKCERR